MAIRLNDIETVFRLEAGPALKGFDQIEKAAKDTEKALKKTDESFRRFGDGLKAAGVGLTAFGAASTAFFALAIKGAREERTQMQQLEATINSTGESFSEAAPKIESFLDELTRTTEFADDQLRPALNRAIFATNSLDEGLRAAELGAKVAAAGFGDLEGNAVLIARLFEGQVGAIGRLIPEFRDLEERLAAGATEATLAAEAISRLEALAAGAPAPDSFNLIAKSLGEIKDAAGGAAADLLNPFATSLAGVAKNAEGLAESGFGRLAAQIGFFLGTIAGGAGPLLIFVGNVAKSAETIEKLGTKFALLEKLKTALLAIFSPTGAVIVGLIILIGLFAKFTLELDKLSRETDALIDKTFGAPRVQVFTKELEKLNATIAGLEDGTISATQAQIVFNTWGLRNLEQAKERVQVLGGIIARLKDEAVAAEENRKADERRAAEDAERKRIEGIVTALEAQKKKEIELDIIKEQLAEKDKRRGQELAQRAGVVPDRPAAPIDFGVDALQLLDTSEAAKTAAKDLSFILEEVTLNATTAGLTIDEMFATASSIIDDAGITLESFAEQLGLSEEAARVLLETLSDAGITAADALLRATEQTEAFNAQLQELVAGAFDALATLGSEFFIDLSEGFDEAAKHAGEFFQRLIKDIGRAIIKAAILQAIISALPGGGFFGGVGRLLGGGGIFQDPVADALARFEGTRFVDLFMQGVSRQFSVARDRIDVALTNNREVSSGNSRPVSVIVKEATPETTVEFTDRFIEPRVRERGRQRSSRGELTGAQIDRLVKDHSQAIDDLRTQMG